MAAPRLSSLLLCAALAVPVAGQVSGPGRLPLWPEGVPGQLSPVPLERLEGDRVTGVGDPALIAYPAPGPGPHAAVIVCPGGSYRRLAIQHEGHDVAAWLNSIGVSAYILKYRMVEYGQPAPLKDVLRAVRLLRSQAPGLRLRADAIGVLGFSAGGHVAGSAMVLWNHPDGRAGTPLDSTSARPDFGLLIYPVITMRDPLAHVASRRNLLGDTPAPALVSRYSLDEQVSAATPPAFLVHGRNDTAVSVEHSRRFADALRGARRPVDLHVFANGPHGFGLGQISGEPVATWPSLAAAWLTRLGAKR